MPGRKSDDRPDHLAVHVRIADHALLSDLLTARLELRFYQADHIRSVRQQFAHRRKHLRQRNEAHVAPCEFDRLGDLFRRDIADVRLLQADYARILPQLPRKLPVAHVDRIDFRGSVLEHAIRKTAGRRADVHTDLSLYADIEHPERFFQFQSAPAHVGDRASADLDDCVLRKSRTRLFFLLTVHVDLSGHDQRLRLRPGLRESALGHENIQSLFFHFITKASRMRAAALSGSSPSFFWSSPMVPCSTKQSGMPRLSMCTSG